MYEIEKNLLDTKDNYGKFLNGAYPHARKIIEDYFYNVLKVEEKEIHWKQGEIRKVSFQHLCLTYRNQVFSFLIAAAKAKKEYQTEDDRMLIEFYLDEQDVKNQLRECGKNNMIPCYVVLYEDSYNTLIYPGNPIFLTETGESLDFSLIDFETPIPASEWELNELGIRFFRDHLPDLGSQLGLKFSIQSACDVVGINPQVWCEAEIIRTKETLYDIFFMVRTFGPKATEVMKFISIVDGFSEEAENLCFGCIIDLIPQDNSPVIYRNSLVYQQFRFISKEELVQISKVIKTAAKEAAEELKEDNQK